MHVKPFGIRTWASVHQGSITRFHPFVGLKHHIYPGGSKVQSQSSTLTFDILLWMSARLFKLNELRKVTFHFPIIFHPSMFHLQINFILPSMPVLKPPRTMLGLNISVPEQQWNLPCNDSLMTRAQEIAPYSICLKGVVSLLSDINLA